ncbi:hypothetical protein VDG1235_1886 [Verrucomicrobiia bacterium DG1235]|nr:hypothetical protein VDG1235_1886 [Verrucomicrobiae bacterium DG1235]
MGEGMAIQLQEFAKQVLFGTTMEEKLSFPREEIVDTDRGDAIKTPRKLARPSHLVLREEGVKASHPSVAKLVDERERGRLLHFFGNHELLATELMALALLKFPDAPASFRRGLLETLKDEQIHTRLYMHRMKQCGVEFGELPLSDYFWRSVSSMEDPLDYVTRLSLTFEQANLDYSREYAKVFESVGDGATSGILDKIYRDEIDHVGFGLKWFRRWKAEGKTDWEAYRERLVFPLSPARAKGDVFNKEGRAEVGFAADFISDLEIFSQSRGRTPSVLWFNPDAERYAAQGTSEGFGKKISAVQEDFAFLPAFVARQGDVLIMRERPSAEFLRSLQAHGFRLPEILPSGGDSGELGLAPDLDRKVGDLRPWAWTPDSVSFLGNVFESVTRPPSVESLWNDGVRNLYSKTWSADWGRRLAEDGYSEDWLAPAEVYGRPARSLEELLALREELAGLGYAAIVCKAPFGTAANGIRCLMTGEELAGSTRAWLERIWEEQGEALVEPWLDRVFDFSVQFEKRGAEFKTVGFTRLVNNGRGQFRGVVTNAFCRGLGEDLIRFIMRRVNRRPRLYHFYEDIVESRLGESLSQTSFCGPLGVDAFVYRDPAGALRLKPIVEINPRFTMGRIGHELGERNAASSCGFFQIVTRSQVRKGGAKSFAEYVDALVAKHPVCLTKEAKPRIISGSFPLSDPAVAKQFLALYHVRETLADLPMVGS